MEFRHAIIQCLFSRMYPLRGQADVVPSQNVSDEEVSKDKMTDWTTVDTSQSPFDEDDKIFHPDDEIIDPKDSIDAPLKRVRPHCDGTDVVEYRISRARTRMATHRSPKEHPPCRTSFPSTLPLHPQTRASTPPYIDLRSPRHRSLFHKTHIFI
jgi:hypothetical protein